MRVQQITATKRQALLLFVQGQRKGKTLGFGRQMDQSIHLAMIYRTYDLLQRVQDADIVVVQDGEAPALDGAIYLQQRGNNLQECFEAALQDTFALGFQRVVAIGGDIPTLELGDIEKALSRTEVVLGPSHDGGFYLAGLGKDDIRLFDDLPWRQPQLFTTLLQRIHDSGRNCRQLKRRGDIDHAGDGRKNASLLVKLVRIWLRLHMQIRSFATGRDGFLANRIPEPRYSSLPPPRSFFC